MNSKAGQLTSPIAFYCILLHATNVRKNYYIRLSEWLKTFQSFPGGTENKSDVFLHVICKRIFCHYSFFPFSHKKEMRRGLRQQSDMFLPGQSLGITVTFKTLATQVSKRQQHPRCMYWIGKTGKSKRSHLSFWRERKTDEILVWKLVGPIFNNGHQSIRFRLVCLAVVSVLSRKRCFAKSGLV